MERAVRRSIDYQCTILEILKMEIQPGRLGAAQTHHLNYEYSSISKAAEEVQAMSRR
jgi:hypothetical protein